MTSVLPALLLAAVTAGAAAPTSAPFAERLEVAGVPNLGRVSPTLLRGGQPTDEGMRALAALDVTVVVDLRDDAGQFAAERALAEGLGMRAVHLPLHGWRTPRREQVEEFLAILCANRDRTVFVHCRRGAERTGVMLAAYRLAADGWSAEHALAEMKAYRFRALLFSHFSAFVRSLETGSGLVLCGLQPDEP
ncbi:MAG: tyrosine-protein phosphatase [Acidobacteria bacterium]|nr:tyrosine-protein phosphatase [Acidobacteriota bacterium]